MIVTEFRLIEETVSKAWEWSVFKAQMEKPEQASALVRSKRNLSRRPNACAPCKRSKLRCDGRLPSCTACTKKRHKSQSECIYIQPPSRRRATTPRAERDPAELHDSSDDSGVEQPPHRGPPCVIEDDKLFGAHSMAQCIDQFKSLAGVRDSITPLTSVSHCTGREVFEDSTSSSVAAEDFDDDIENHLSMATLCSFSLPGIVTQSLPPYLRTLYDEATRLQRLMRMGKLMKAWIEMPRLVRLAQLDRLDHNQGAKPPPPETPESEFRRRVWWLILELDIQISMHIGRPLAVRAKLGIERPNLDGVEGAYKQLEQSKLDFKQYALEVLGELCVDDDELNEQDHETLVELSKMERLQKMEKRLPPMPGLEQNEQLVIAIGDHKIELLALKIMLCCTLVKSAEKQRSGFFKIDFHKDGALGQIKPAAKTGRPRAANRDEVQSYQVIILDAARSILETFQQVAAVDVSDHYANWNRYFDAYSAAAILAIAALRWEAQSSANITLIANIFSLMTAISDRNPQCHIVTVAVTRIGELYAELQNCQLSATHKQRVKEEASEPATIPRSKQNKRGDSPSKAKGSSVNHPKKRKSNEISADTRGNIKRIRIEPVSPDKYQSPDDDYGNGNDDYAQYPQQQDFGSRASDLGFNTAEVYQQGAIVSYNTAGEAATGTTTSLDGGMDATHYPQNWHYNDQGNLTNDHGIPYEWYHTPLAGPQPPFLDLDDWQVFDGTQQLQTSTTPYQSNLNNDQMIRMSRAAAAQDLTGQPQYFTQDTPAQAHPASATQPLTSLQLSHPQQRRGTSQDRGAWQFLQHHHHHHLLRRNSGMATPMTTGLSEVFGQGHSAYIQSSQIPTTTGAWE